MNEQKTIEVQNMAGTSIDIPKATEMVQLPLNISPKGVRTFEVPKNKYQIIKESNERWEFMERMQ